VINIFNPLADFCKLSNVVSVSYQPGICLFEQLLAFQNGLYSVQLCYKYTTLLCYGKYFPPYSCVTNPLSCCYGKNFPPHIFVRNPPSCSVMERTFLRRVVLEIHYPAVLWKVLSSVQLCYKSTILLLWKGLSSAYFC
jgi:hypothetical protein